MRVGPGCIGSRVVPSLTARSTWSGYSLLELVFVAGIGATISAIAVPEYLVALDDFRTSGAARYVSARFQRARQEAVMRSADVALRFTPSGTGYTYEVYVDGNGNGVLVRDIQRNIDRSIAAAERLSEQFSGVDFGAIPSLPAIDGGTPPGSDPIRLGASNTASFSAAGTSSSGTVYIRGRRNSQYAVRMFGDTGKTRLLKFDRRSRQWRPL